MSKPPSTPGQRIDELIALRNRIDHDIVEETRKAIANLMDVRDRIDDAINELGAHLPKRRSRKTPAACGTESGYQAHRHRKESACDDCKAAHATHVRRADAVRRATQGAA